MHNYPTRNNNKFIAPKRNMRKSEVSKNFKSIKVCNSSCSSSSSGSSSSRTDRWVHFQQNAGLRLFVHT